MLYKAVSSQWQDIERTAGWSASPIFRHHAPGYYIKQTDKKPQDKLSISENAEFDPETKMFVIPVNKWYYHLDDKKQHYLHLLSWYLLFPFLLLISYFWHIS